MRKFLMLTLVVILSFTLPSCSKPKIKATGEVLAFAFTSTASPLKKGCYLSFVDTESEIQQSIKLGPHYAASVTYADPYIFIPMHMNIKGIQDITEWVYYVNIHDGQQGRFRVAWQPRKVIPYLDSYIVVSELHGSDTCIQLFNSDFELLQEETVPDSFFAQNALLLGDNLFTNAFDNDYGGVRCYSLEGNLAWEFIEFPKPTGSLSIAEWNGKVIASDGAQTIWLLDPESLEIETLGSLPPSLPPVQGPGVSLVVGDWLMIGDTYSDYAFVYNLITGETKQLVFEDWISHLSHIDDYVIVSHNMGRTIVDSNWEISEFQHIPDTRYMTNFVPVTLP